MLNLPCLIDCMLLSVLVLCYSESVKLEPLSNMSLKTTLTLPLSSSGNSLSISHIKLTFPQPHGSVFTTTKSIDGTLESSNSLQLIFSCQSPDSVNNCTVLMSEIFSQNTSLADISLDFVTPDYSVLFSKCTFDMGASGVTAWKSSSTTFDSGSSLTITVSTASNTVISTCSSCNISYDATSFACIPSSGSITVTKVGTTGVSISLSTDTCPELPKHIKSMQTARAILYSCTCTLSGSTSTQSPATFTVLELRHPVNVGIILLDIFFVVGTIACIVLIVIGLMKFSDPGTCKCQSKLHKRKQAHLAAHGDSQGQLTAHVPATIDALSTTEPSVLGEIRSDVDMSCISHQTNTGGSRPLFTQRVSQ